MQIIADFHFYNFNPFNPLNQRLPFLYLVYPHTKIFGVRVY